MFFTKKKMLKGTNFQRRTRALLFYVGYLVLSQILTCYSRWLIIKAGVSPATLVALKFEMAAAGCGFLCISREGWDFLLPRNFWESFRKGLAQTILSIAYIGAIPLGMTQAQVSALQLAGLPIMVNCFKPNLDTFHRRNLWRFAAFSIAATSLLTVKNDQGGSLQGLFAVLTGVACIAFLETQNASEKGESAARSIFWQNFLPAIAVTVLWSMPFPVIGRAQLPSNVGLFFATMALITATQVNPFLLRQAYKWAAPKSSDIRVNETWVQVLRVQGTPIQRLSSLNGLSVVLGAASDALVFGVELHTQVIALLLVVFAVAVSWHLSPESD